MQGVPFPKTVRLWIDSVPPLHAWPGRLKKIILILAISICIGAYILLFSGLLSTGGLLLQLVLDQ